MTHSVHRDPLSAWKYLVQHGGIELEGRDEGLDQRILQRLDPCAPSLDDALATATMPAFTRAFFEAVHPFLAMFRDILSFFEHADVTMGPAQWTLQVDDVDLNLSHFQKWIGTWCGVGIAQMQIPAVDWNGVWRLWRVLCDKEEIGAEIRRSFNQGQPQLPQDVQTWVDMHNRGNYLPLPASLQSPRCPPELLASASIAQAALSRLREMDLTRERLMELRRDYRRDPDRSDALDFWSIAQNETDYWLRSYIVALSAAATLLTQAQLAGLGRDLDLVLADFPLRPFNVEVSIAELESVLSLPIWQKRYELYSVWVATEMVRALKGHQIELHHEHGRIVFAFHETLVATIHSSPGPFRIISERRWPLEDPRGRGRTGSVQPDHGLWTSEYGHDTCRMVVEVKHYKRSVKRAFLAVFEDYARAFPEGEVYLVNYGPTGRAVWDVSRSIRERCHAIQRLTPTSLEARNELAQAVRECVGEPVLSWPYGLHASADVVVVIDVSASMKTVLHSRHTEALVRKIVASECPRELIALDTAVVGTWPPNEEGFAELIETNGGSTALGPAIVDLLRRVARVVVITDEGGLETLSGLHATMHDCQELESQGVCVRVCTRGDYGQERDPGRIA
ncbi:MAG: VWA domain-containing protein [Phycisphaerae bacterium]|nr:VWA domain-containing protein [Phycisphaerae bacterium]